MDKNSLLKNKDILSFLSVDSKGVRRMGHTDDSFSQIPISDMFVVLVESDLSRKENVKYFNPSGNWNSFHYSLSVVRDSINANQDARNSLGTDMNLLKTLVYQSKLNDASALLASICKRLVKMGVIPIKESE